MMKNRKQFFNIFLLSLLVVFGCIFSGCTASEKKVLQDDESKEILYQASSIDILMDGGYDGFVEIGDLKNHGDMGIGTIDMLDGELVAIDGDYYSVKSDGIPYLLTDDTKVPFADVTFFDEDFSVEMIDVENISEFENIINENLPFEDIFYAIKFSGTFPYIKTRAIPKQEEPYPKLIDAVKDQSVFEYNDINGTVVGFWSPEFAEGMNVPGVHIHFISDDRKAGGHILDLKFDDAEVLFDKTAEYYVILSETGLGQSSERGSSSDKKSELSLIEK